MIFHSSHSPQSLRRGNLVRWTCWIKDQHGEREIQVHAATKVDVLKRADVLVHLLNERGGFDEHQQQKES